MRHMIQPAVLATRIPIWTLPVFSVINQVNTLCIQVCVFPEISVVGYAVVCQTRVVEFASGDEPSPGLYDLLGRAPRRCGAALQTGAAGRPQGRSRHQLL